MENSAEETKLNTALEALESARKLRRMRRTYGVNSIYLLVEDVDGDWLEQWGNDEVLGSEDFQEKLDFLVAISRREEFQKDIQKIEEKISEADQEIHQKIKLEDLDFILDSYRELVDDREIY